MENEKRKNVSAEKCGFSSVYHFSREFKRKNGITPTQYAQNNKILKI